MSRFSRANRFVVVRVAALLMFLPGIALFTGCSHIGPKTVSVDRFDYSTAIAESWKQQTLLNIVKLRYMDLPVFVDVASIVSGYSLQTGVNVGATVSSQSAVQGDFLAAGSQAIYTDRPTITYVPMTGEKFLRGLITPIDPKNIFFMLQAGYSADFILGLTVQGLNGVRNHSVVGGVAREADPEFSRALHLLREVQHAGAVGMRVEEDITKGQTAVLFFQQDDLPSDILEKVVEVRRLLRLTAKGERFVLSYSPMRGGDDELTVNSRSMLQIMSAFASYLEVPEEDLKAHRAVPAFEGGDDKNQRDDVKIYSGKDKPTNAFTAVRYRDHWFWIDDGDWKTKRALTAIMFFFTLAETGETGKLPLITIPAQ